MIKRAKTRMLGVELIVGARYRITWESGPIDKAPVCFEGFDKFGALFSRRGYGNLPGRWDLEGRQTTSMAFKNIFIIERIYA